MGWDRGEMSFGGEESMVRGLLDVFGDKKYLIWAGGHKVLIVLKEGADPETQLSSWYHALILADSYPTDSEKESVETTMKTIEKTLR